HLHGELTKVRSTTNAHLIYDWEDDCNLGDTCPKGEQLRPHIVWFGEEVPMIARAAKEVSEADIVLIIGTSMQVYPAAGLVAHTQFGVPIYYIDPKPSINHELQHIEKLTIVAETATKGVRKVVNQLIQVAKQQANG
ncbi:MAG: Sir2 family NAD-dependent protein deacetylase, partial [Bacteroidota bacterium]